VAFFADLRSRRRLQEERKRSDDLLSEERALHAKQIAEERALASQRLRDQFAHSDTQLAEERAHSAAQLQEDRLWNRRVDLYARINLALRRYIEQPPTSPDGKFVYAADVAELASVVSEATMLASEPLADLLNQFVYDNPDSERELDIWATFQRAARAELDVDRMQQSSAWASRAAHRDIQHGNPSAAQPSDP
jgi:hypothetical protein